MTFNNLNFLSVLFIFFAFFIVLFLFNFFIKKQINFNQNYLLISSSKYFYLKYIFLILSFLIIWFSLFEPLFWQKKITLEAKWIDILFTLDVSKSMNVADISDWKRSFTRLNSAKNSIANFVNNHKEDRFWLVIFAGDSISTIPLTTDHNIFLTFLKWVDYRNLTKQWTDFKKAISMSADRFLKDSKRSKVVVLISDWGDRDEDLDLDYIKQIKKQKEWIAFSIVWIWTNKWWKIITWEDFFWRISYQIYNWDYVISKLNSWTLEDLATSLDWKYFKINDKKDLLKLNSEIENLKKETIWKDEFWEKNNIWRFLSFISFFFFALFLLFYSFEDILSLRGSITKQSIK